jgi:hypothetical protein
LQEGEEGEDEMEGGYCLEGEFPSIKTSGTILIAISEINYIKHYTDQNYVHRHSYLGSD